MAQSTLTTRFDASEEHVMPYVKAPKNLPKHWPFMREVHGKQRMSNGGYSRHWTGDAAWRAAGDSQDTPVENK